VLVLDTLNFSFWGSGRGYWQLAEALRDAQGPIVVTGSLYLVGRVRAVLVDDPVLRDPEPVG